MIIIETLEKVVCYGDELIGSIIYNKKDHTCEVKLNNFEETVVELENVTKVGHYASAEEYDIASWKI